MSAASQEPQKGAPQEEAQNQSQDPKPPTTIRELVEGMTLQQHRLFLKEQVTFLHEAGIMSFAAISVPATLFPEDQRKALSKDAEAQGVMQAEEEVKNVTLYYAAIETEEQREELLRILREIPLSKPKVAPEADRKDG